MDEIDASAWNARKNIGKLVIVVNYIFNFSCLVFVTVCLAGSAKEAYENLRKKKTTTLKKGMKEDFSLRNRKRNEGSASQFSNIALQMAAESSLEVSEIGLFPQNDNSKLEFNTNSLDVLEDNSQGEYHPKKIRKQTRKRLRLVPNNSSKIITGVNSTSTVEGIMASSSSSPNLKGFERARRVSGDGILEELRRNRRRKPRIEQCVQEERAEVLPPHLKHLFVVKKGKFVLK